MTRTSNEFDLPLKLLRAELARSDLLPPPYERYRPLLADGIDFFLRRLSPARLRRLLLEQSQMPLSTSMEERVVTLLHHLPTLHKLGQVLARDRRLHPGFRARLQELESLEPRTPKRAILRQLNREFPRWRQAGIELEAQPLAEGSVAVVMPFQWRQAPRAPARPGVFKLLKPGIDSRLAEDLAIWSSLGKFLDAECERYHLPELDYQDTIETVKDLMTHEIRLGEEQAHMAEAARFYAASETVVIPALFPFCTPRLTAMERIPGDPLTHYLARPEPAHENLAPMIAEALIARPVFSRQPATLFHGDPHAGNLFVTSDRRLAILDWSLAGRLRKDDRGELIQLLLGALTLDLSAMQSAIHHLASATPRPAALHNVLQAGLREIRLGQFPGVDWLTRLLDAAVAEASVHFHSSFLLFRKTLLTLEGVMADVTATDAPGGSRQLDRSLLAQFFHQFLREWPERFRQAPASRAFATHLSNHDLLTLLWSVPATMVRFWAQTGQQALRAFPAEKALAS